MNAIALVVFLASNGATARIPRRILPPTFAAMARRFYSFVCSETLLGQKKVETTQNSLFLCCMHTSFWLHWAPYSSYCRPVDAMHICTLFVFSQRSIKHNGKTIQYKPANGHFQRKKLRSIDPKGERKGTEGGGEKGELANRTNPRILKCMLSCIMYLHLYKKFFVCLTDGTTKIERETPRQAATGVSENTEDCLSPLDRLLFREGA